VENPEVKALWARAIQLHGQGRYGDALACLLPLEARMPQNAALLSNVGMVYRDKGDLVRAELYLRRACAAQPDNAKIHFNLGVALLRAGQLREGLEEYEWRWQVPQFAGQRREFPQPLWNGEPLNGRRILIYGEQGAGDAIQFVRYAPLVRDAGGEVIIEVLPHLERLLGWMDGGYRVVNALSPHLERLQSWMDGEYWLVDALPVGGQFDVQCPLMGLPRRFGTGLDSIPAPAAFSIPPALTAKWAERLQTGRTAIGLVWAGNPRHGNDAARSLPVESLLPLTRLAGVQCWSLQVGPATADTPNAMLNLAEELVDFGETAAAISALDLVIAVDTAVAHLAGTLGKPVWLLAAYASDWRWMLDRDDSPWYPSLRIFRQKRPGDWGEVIERVVAELR
jgi:tetratricopeptide (TPR) repeat protein